MVKMSSVGVISSTYSMAESGETGESIEFINIPDLPTPVNNVSSNYFMNIADSTPDLSPEEIRHWLKQFIQENIELKDALQDNNMKMADQQNEVAAWYEGINQTNRYLKKNLEEEQKCSQELKETNETLKRKVHVLEEEQKLSQELKETNETLMQKVQVLEIKNKFSEDYHKVECAGLNEELIKLREQFSSLREWQKEQTFQRQFAMNNQEIPLESNNLQSRSEILEEEKRALTAFNNQLQSELSNLKVEEDSEIDNEEPTVYNDEETGYAFVINPDKAYKYRKIDDTGLKEILLKLKQEQVKVSSLTQELAEAKVQVVHLKKLLEEQNEQILLQNMHIQASALSIENSNQDANDPDLIISVEKYEVSTQIPEVENGATQYQPDEDLREELELTKDKLCRVTSYMGNYKDRCVKLQSQYEEILQHVEKQNENKATEQVVIELLQQENKELQGALFREKATHHNQMANFVEARLALAQRTAEYSRVSSELESLKSQNGACSLQEQSLDTKHQHQLDSLTAQQLFSEQQLEEQKLIIQNLHLKIASIQKDSESIPILKSQIDVYKTNYESEKKAREIIAANLKDYQETLKNVQEELLTPQKSRESEAGSSMNKTSSSCSSIKTKKYRNYSFPKKMREVQEIELSCPFCFKVFTNKLAIQDHVHSCSEDPDRKLL